MGIFQPGSLVKQTNECFWMAFAYDDWSLPGRIENTAFAGDWKDTWRNINGQYRRHALPPCSVRI
jgi:hypothetical protein